MNDYNHGQVWRFEAEPLMVFMATFFLGVAIATGVWFVIAWFTLWLALEILPCTRWYLRLRDGGDLNL